ncbi:hypothetical protein [Acinetobacter pittii]|uniref:hypothetical protein n=1 Tax=Acinetobacter pittii TaxID=48296 RepID=UPI00148EE914|nr:hypothetical protein [Acinetobacter pittii]
MSSSNTEQLKAYLSKMTVEERKAFAKACLTTLGNLQQIIYVPIKLLGLSQKNGWPHQIAVMHVRNWMEKLFLSMNLLWLVATSKTHHFILIADVTHCQ